MSEISKLFASVKTMGIKLGLMKSDDSDEEVQEVNRTALELLAAQKGKPVTVETSEKTESKTVETVSKQEHDALKQEVETLKKSVSTLSNDVKTVQTDVQTLGKRPKNDASDGEKDIEGIEKKKSSTPEWDNLKKQMGLK